MPTGYTAAIADGVTFEQFALNCARAFGALIDMRDEPSDAPIPERFEPSNYHEKKIAEINDELVRLKEMSQDEAKMVAHQEWRAAEQPRLELAQREGEDDEVGHVAQHQADPVALPHADRFELGGAAVDPVEQTPPGQVGVPVEERLRAAFGLYGLH